MNIQILCGVSFHENNLDKQVDLFTTVRLILNTNVENCTENLFEIIGVRINARARILSRVLVLVAKQILQCRLRLDPVSDTRCFYADLRRIHALLESQLGHENHASRCFH